MIDKTEYDPPSDDPSDVCPQQPNGQPHQSATSAEVADYIADLLQELRELSAASGHAPLAMLLELAQREAKRIALRAISVNQTPFPPMVG